MAYQLRNEKGIQIKYEDKDVIVSDTLEVKIEELDEKNMSFVAVGSTEDVDRDNDIVRQSGWKLANFKKNPVIPWSHNYYGVPIAKSLKTWVDEKAAKGPRLLFKPKFDADDDNSVKIFNKYKNGFLTSFSVGFQGIDWEFRDEENRWFGGREFTKQELLEISSVAVPANPNATTRLGMNGSMASNLIQSGYPQMFAKTEMGLFYPVVDIALFSEPKEFQVADGIIGLKAVPLDDDVKIDGPVAYIFDENQFNDKSANEWIKENAQPSYTTKYFHIKFSEEDGISLEADTTTNNIKLFETSIDMCNVGVSDEVDVSDIEIEDDDDPNKQTDIDSNETTVQDSEDDSRSANEETTTGKSEPDGTDNPPETDVEDSNDKTGEDAVVIPVKQMIEVVTTIKDSSGNVIDQMTETVASSKEFKSVIEFVNFKSNELISLLKDEIKKLKQSNEHLRKQKTVANDNDIPDNDHNLDIDSDKTTSEDNEKFIELDESLIASPDNNDKTNSDEDTIEIDEALFEESKSTTGQVVKDALVEALRKGLTDALKDASGSID